MKRIPGAVALVVGLCACGSVARVAAPKTVFDFGPPVEALAGAGLRSDVGIEVKAPPWFDSMAVEYRLAYAEPQVLRDYAEARWAGPPAQLVAQRLRQRLQMPAPAGGGCRVLLVVEEFSQTFDAPDKSRAVLRGQVTLSDRRGAVLTRRAVAGEAPATADARGGVVAMAAAVDAAAQAIGGWLDEAARQGRLKDCGG